MEKIKTSESAIEQLQEEQKVLQKLVHQTNTLVRNSIGINESIQGYTNQISTHTVKLEQTLERATRALKLLQKLSEGEAKFTDTLQQFRKDATDKSEAFTKFVEYLLMHKDGYNRLTERLSQGMKTLDDDARRYLETRKDQLDKFYEVSIQQFADLVAAEKRLFEESVNQIKPEGLQKALDQLNLLTSIHEHLSQLELSDEGIGLLAGIDQQLGKIERSNKATFQVFDRQLNLMEESSEKNLLLLKTMVQEIKNVQYAVLLGYLILIVFFFLLFFD